MKLAKQFNQVLVISPEPWNGHFVSKHHYAQTLANLGAKVFFMGPPNQTSVEIKIQETQYDNLYHLISPIVARGLRFYPGFLRRRTEARWLKKVETVIGSEFSMIWLFENSRFFDMGFSGDRLKIYHQVDYNQNFHVRKAALSADICFCTTDFILKELEAYNKCSYKIHHGVSKKQELLGLTDSQKNRFDKSKLNVAYIGNLDIKYLDINTFNQLIHLYPEICFHLIGGHSIDNEIYRKNSTSDNVIWWGKVKSELILPILNRVDAVLVIYKNDSYMDQASPHKIMEYLASGKVVIATYTDEYKDKSELLEMVEENGDYILNFDTVINNLTYQNSKKRQKLRTDFADNHTYEKQFAKIISYLESNNLIK